MLEAPFRAARDAWRQNPFPDARQRVDRLERLERALLAHEHAVADALNKDFGGRHPTEVLFSETYVSLSAIQQARQHVGEWMAERPRAIDWPLWPARAYVVPQPLGVVGIIVPWNYPVFLSLAPLAGALSAGNHVLIKPSEFTPATAEVLRKIVPDDVATVVTGDAETGKAFARLPFDHLLFTGSTTVGRQVMRAAADNLTPVTLELGGKSPAIVDASANLRRAAEDIVYGKLLNGGQTCIAPDYVLVARRHLDRFVDEAAKAIDRYWPSHDYTSMITQRHAERIAGYVGEARARGVPTVERGRAVILVDPPDDLAVMREEIFGPVLPVKPFDSLEEAIARVNAQERPLALYLFAGDAEVVERVTRETVAGAMCVNDTLIQIAAENLPFGGVGASGMGQYHGRDGFDTFSKLKPVFRRRWPGLSRTLRPPYGAMHNLLRRILVR